MTGKREGEIGFVRGPDEEGDINNRGYYTSLPLPIFRPFGFFLVFCRNPNQNQGVWGKLCARRYGRIPGADTGCESLVVKAWK